MSRVNLSTVMNVAAAVAMRARPLPTAGGSEEFVEGEVSYWTLFWVRLVKVTLGFTGLAAVVALILAGVFFLEGKPWWIVIPSVILGGSFLAVGLYTFLDWMESRREAVARAKSLAAQRPKRKC